MLKIEDLTCGYNKKPVLSNITLEFILGEVVCILGSNGIGKTTFFKTLLGFNKAIGGHVYLDDIHMNELSHKERAKLIAYVPQAHQMPFDFRVDEVVLMGRTVHMKGPVPSLSDKAKVKAVMDDLGIGYLKNKSFMKISGGERQMALIARALVQETDIIIMDEPTSNLDFGNQSKIMMLIRQLQTYNKLIIMTTHSPNQVFESASRVVAFKDGSLYASGCPDEVITNTFLKDIYGIEGKVYQVQDTDQKVCLSQ